MSQSPMHTRLYTQQDTYTKFLKDLLNITVLYYWRCEQSSGFLWHKIDTASTCQNVISREVLEISPLR